jgi:hypothetical protein
MAKKANNGNRKKEPSRETTTMLQLEYEKAQDSAEHHDRLLWYVTSIVWTGNLIVLGQIANLTEIQLTRIPVILVSVLALVLNLFLWAASYQFRLIKKQKYGFCKQLEKDKVREMLGQHTNVRYPPGVMWTLYSFVTILFLVVWLAILFIAASHILC